MTNTSPLQPHDMPKLEVPFVRKMIDGHYVVTPEVAEGYSWVFDDDLVQVTEKLHGSNVSIFIQNGTITSCWSRNERIPFFTKHKRPLIDALLNSYASGYMEFLLDGQHFGEAVGKGIASNIYNLDKPTWIPFNTYARENLRYESWGKYPKTFSSISKWFETIQSLFSSMRDNKEVLAEGVVFTHPDGRMAKLRRDNFDWFVGRRHKEREKNR